MKRWTLLLTLFFLSSCQERAVNRTYPSLDASIARMTDVSPDTRCAEAYQEMNLLGGCYPATSDPDVTARVVVSALEEDGWKRESLLRKDFGTWRTVLVRPDEKLAVSVRWLTSQSEGLNQRLFKEGYQSLVNLTLNRAVKQTEVSTSP
ncbi:hypothetical protein [Deinococcus sp. LM3]|uniref:hypothetical protein n=1 Tax=Deinococcus sp. LM3 TaxID=1938608 RepID=UPI000992C7FD|nr:hypothetical protein [Deinococcus sp. LM3]OOV11350.1 hypothetical protein BXU09_19990 [Deinococcus sp. LM3]